MLAAGRHRRMYLDRYFDAKGAGAALAIRLDGSSGYQECVGLADIDGGVPISATTSFDLASVTKMFTSAAVLMLVDDNRIRLDDPIVRHLSIDLSSAERLITVQDLLWHTSGIPDYLLSSGLDEHELDREAVLDWLERADDQFHPGTTHEYSNTNYFLLAEIVSHVAGMPYKEFIKKRMFEAYGLDDSFVITDYPGNRLRAHGYVSEGFGRLKYVPSENDITTVGDGGIFSSLTDLMRWQELFFSGQIVSRSSVDHATTAGRLDNGVSFDYGCGMIVESLGDDGIWCGHTGSWHGASALCGRYMNDGLTVIVLSNDQLAPVVRIAERSAAAWRDQTQ